MKRCGLCNRILLPWERRWLWVYRWTPLGDRMDCGGDCFRCVDEIEQHLQSK